MTPSMVRVGLLLAAMGVFAAAAYAADTVTVGAIYPLSHDRDAKFAIETAEEIVNAPHQGLETLPLGAGQGLPNLSGAKIAVEFADDLGNPSVAQGQALRLITQDRVAALIGRHSRISEHAAAWSHLLRRSMISRRRGSPSALRIASRWLGGRLMRSSSLSTSCF